MKYLSSSTDFLLIKLWVMVESINTTILYFLLHLMILKVCRVMIPTKAWAKVIVVFSSSISASSHPKDYRLSSCDSSKSCSSSNASLSMFSIINNCFCAHSVLCVIFGYIRNKDLLTFLSISLVVIQSTTRNYDITGACDGILLSIYGYISC